MNEYSRIIIESYDSRFERLAKIVARSYKSDEEANFVFEFIEYCADEELRKALIDLDEFMVGY